MKKVLIVISFLFPLILVSGEIDRSVGQFIFNNPGKNVKVWVFFKDKLILNVENKIPKETLKRRLNRGKLQNIQKSDNEVDENYIQQIVNHSIKIRNKSGWLNAVSIEVEPDKIDTIASLNFVKELKLVRSLKKNHLKF